MLLKQISIFIENSPGRLYEVTSALGEAGINLRALSLVDKGDFGVLRLLVSDVATARRIMMEKQLPARVDDVVAAEIDDTPGSLARILKPLTTAHVNVLYMYAFVGFSTGRAVMIFHFSDNKKAIGILQKQGIRILDAEAFALSEASA
ncbi:MAG: hypothetical protein U1C55_07205 [Smithellaceae bacterium]|nr:hypothetical protein [Smithellaceae bacterium]